MTVWNVFGFMLRLPSFRHLSAAGALHAFYGYGAAMFVPAFLIRVHEFGTGELSTYLAAIGFVFGGLGTFLGGRVGDWLASGKRSPPSVCLVLLHLLLNSEREKLEFEKCWVVPR